MMASPRIFFIIICTLGMIIWLYLFLGVTRPEPKPSMEGVIDKMSYALYSLKEQVRQENEELSRLRKAVDDLSLYKFPVKASLYVVLPGVLMTLWRFFLG
ncbi:DegQ family protein [Oesophagostomum dentatum]|uniref:DegQ family protein n=1 Tax=Oesophagostomum dentatum TaxID=61180 RepID=A0A0B1S393_OESDE|nr:DegQ family protein [Oesophagostomum dentatum]